MCVPQYQTLWYTTRAIEGSIPVETLSSQTIDCNYKTVYHEYDIDIPKIEFILILISYVILFRKHMVLRYQIQITFFSAVR